MKNIEVYALGNAIVDLQFMVTEEELVNLELRKGGMTLVSSKQQERLINTLGSKKCNQASGGSAANTLIALSQLGVSSALCCLVGNDEYGSFYYNKMKELGVISHPAPISNKSTGTCVIFITPDAERTMNTNLGVNEELCDKHIDSQLISNSKWLYIEGYLLSSENGQKAVLQAIDIAIRNQTKVALSFSDTFIVHAFRPILEKVISKSNLLFANLAEAQAYTQCLSSEPDEVFSKFAKLSCNHAMTCGANGAIINYENQKVKVSAPEIQAIDTTGAGDMFAAGFLYGISKGKDAHSSGIIACTLASTIVSQMGPRYEGDLSEIANKITC